MRLQWRTASFTLALSACLAAGLAVPAAPLYGQPPVVHVMVRNDAAQDVVVYAYRGGERIRVGSVLGHGTCVVSIPPGMARPGHVQLLLHPATRGADFLADDVAIRPDEEHAELHVTPTLEESSVTVVPGALRP
jgi:hypothetical protein